MLTEDTLARIAAEAGLTTPSIVIRELPTAGRGACEPLLHAELNPDLPLPAASMIKVPIAAALCAAWASGAHRRATNAREHRAKQLNDQRRGVSVRPRLRGDA